MALSPLTRHLFLGMAAAGSLALLSLVCISAAAAESIRVLLAQEAPFVDVRSDGALALVTETGDTKTLHAPIRLTARADGLHVDGRRIMGGHVLIRPLRSNLTLDDRERGGSVRGHSAPDQRNCTSVAQGTWARGRQSG